MLILAIILFGMCIGGVAQVILGRPKNGVDWGMALVTGIGGSFIGGLLSGPSSPPAARPRVISPTASIARAPVVASQVAANASFELSRRARVVDAVRRTLLPR